MRRFFTLRTTAWATSLIPAFIVLVVVLENWTGARALAAAKEKIVRQGETLDLEKLLAVPVPESENFMALSALAGVTRSETFDDKARHEALSQLDWWSLSIKHRTMKPRPEMNGGCVRGQTFDWRVAAEFLREVTYIDTPPGASAAEVLGSIDRLHPLLKELGDGATQRPQSVFVPPFQWSHLDGRVDGPLMPHLNPCQRVACALALRAHFAIHAADFEQAVRGVQAGARITQALGEEPSVLGLLVAVTTFAHEVNALWALLNARGATEAQLARLQADLQRHDFLRNALHAVRGELVFMIGAVQRMKMQRDEVVAFVGGIYPSMLRNLLVKLVPDGWFDHNAANCLEYGTKFLREPLGTGDWNAIRAGLDGLDQAVQDHRSMYSPHHILAVSSMPAFGSVVWQAIYCEILRRQGLVAIALERHRLAHGGPPAKLDALVPAFLPAMPLDVIDGKPLRYRVENHGYSLWSLGPDAQDDGGALPAKEEARRIDRDDYAGDWVWHVSGSD